MKKNHITRYQSFIFQLECCTYQNAYTYMISEPHLIPKKSRIALAVPEGSDPLLALLNYFPDATGVSQDFELNTIIVEHLRRTTQWYEEK